MEATEAISSAYDHDQALKLSDSVYPSVKMS